MIEKHFTTDRNLPGRDNQFAILPDELAFLRNYINLREKVMEYKGNTFQPCEEEVREIYTGRFDG